MVFWDSFFYGLQVSLTTLIDFFFFEFFVFFFPILIDVVTEEERLIDALNGVKGIIFLKMLFDVYG